MDLPPVPLITMHACPCMSWSLVKLGFEIGFGSIAWVCRGFRGTCYAMRHLEFHESRKMNQANHMFTYIRHGKAV
uniref:Uncharacterized protein n=1 Tax=Populus trichocarpa TaxID=3694 RepID=A0A3N7HXI9_POPTR